ncbi:Scr1 family TA system antitoxin-like transcriptional regulator [Kitasatospora sp. NBC_01300]|uniref:helix-turn-helix domain-containing protein n=1 Tax=Kitasatospora sp. NBC_01300 TaxID=2903574 RepID=UPI00352FE874|nr:helix-turn-helix transcriptional regulator [Kitasatospora sp. NBC_01300]WSK08394.1 helix-turn-helix transcriptional regulator [Kitasatospora sp. NBC_01300]
MNKRELGPPTSPAAEFGVLLRTSREQRGWTQEHLAELIGCTSSYISALEHGRRKPSQQISTALDRVFESGERFLREWSTSGRRVLFEGFDEYLRNEAKAIALRLFEINLVPSLLQTPEYSRVFQEAAVLRGIATQQQADERIEKVLLRQQALARDPAPHVQVVMDEGALRRPIGGRDVMVAQLRYLEALAARPRFLVQVCPTAAGENRPFGHPITLLTMPNRAIVGYGETQRRGYLERDPETLAEWVSEYDHLQAEALRRAASVEFIRNVRKGFEHG